MSQQPDLLGLLRAALEAVGPPTVDFDERRLTIFAEIEAERARQDAKWGEQNHPSSDNNDPEMHNLPSAYEARRDCERQARGGLLTWTDIAVEELSEAVEESDPAAQRAELVQLAAVVVAWIECLDRRNP